jgi:hypothetical protein
MNTVAVKKPQRRAVLDEELPYGLKELLLFPTLVSLGISPIAFVATLVTGGPDVYLIAAGFVAGLAVVSFSVTSLIGGLGLVPTMARRLSRRFARLRRRSLGTKPALWDQWVDGPYRGRRPVVHRAQGRRAGTHRPRLRRGPG